jgi:hypothetical protein
LFARFCRLHKNVKNLKESRNLKRFFAATSGSTAMMFGLAMPAMMAGIGIASDYATFSMKLNSLQTAADQAALAGAKELTITGSSKEKIEQLAKTYVQQNLLEDFGRVEVITTLDDENNSVKVRIEEKWTPFFAHFIGANITPVIAEATAGLYGESKICVLALTGSGPGAVSMTTNSHLKANGCTVYSNSTSSNSVFLGDISTLEAASICTAGGVKNNGSLSGANVVTDCPVLPDPLANRPTPPVGACDFTKTEVKTGSVSLKPGVYCSGLTIKGDAQVTFEPGDYIIKDGPFIVAEKASITGKDVGFFMTGSFSLLHFLQDASVDLEGREKGPLAGMLMFDDPKASGFLRIHSISAKNAHTLTGTIYIPKGNLIVDPTADVGQRSAYTAIIAGRLVVQNGPTLTLNSNYDATSVPVPEGIRTASEVRLLN